MSIHQGGAVEEILMKAKCKWCVLLSILLVSGTLHLGTAWPAGAGQTHGVPATQVASPVASQTPHAGDESLLGTLPPELREAGAAILRESDDDARNRLIRKLLQEAGGPSHGNRVAPKARQFLVALVDEEQCPHNSAPCIALVSATLRDTPDPVLRTALERWASSHRDPQVAVTALNALLEVDSRELSRLLQRRIDLAKATGDSAALRTLGRAQERLGWSEWGLATLPAFFWDAPPVFSVKPASASIRVLAISDFGAGPEGQQLAADSILKYHRTRPFDFGLTLGDNYQDDGAHSPTDSRWHDYWGRWYPQLGIPFYVTLGNHDWRSPDGPAAEILFSQKNPEWRLPALYYTFTAGPVQFFAMNTVLLSEAQLVWLREELEKSTARWKIVYGHYHVYSALRGDNDDLIKRLLPILEANHVDLYLCGHEHLFQHLKPEGGVQFFVNGAAGGEGRSVRQQAYGRVLSAAEKKQGFTVLEADGTGLTVRFFGEDGEQLYDYTLKK
jgi:tartrate-resistant acid phosphatase type 5